LRVAGAERYEQVTLNQVASTKVGATRQPDPKAALVTVTMPPLEATAARTLAKLRVAFNKVARPLQARCYQDLVRYCQRLYDFQSRNINSSSMCNLAPTGL